MATPTRWAPWIELPTQGNGVTFNTATTTALTNAVVLVPDLDCRVVVHCLVDVECTVFNPGGGYFTAALYVGGTIVANVPTFRWQAPAHGERMTWGWSVPYDMTKETSYSFDLRGTLSATGATYVVASGYTTSIGPFVVLPRLW